MKSNIKTGKSKTICLDYLEVSLIGNLPCYSNTPQYEYINNNCYLEFIHDHGNKFFNTVCSLYIDNRCIGELKYNPKTPFINDETVHFKYVNHLLYTKDYLKYIDQINKLLGLELHHIVRIDIATDVIKHNLIDFIKTYQNSVKIHQKGRKKALTIKSIGKEYKTVYVGSTKSDKFIKIYNKSKELEQSDKPYIPYYWGVNGMDFKNNDVERLELTLKTKQASTININELNNGNYLASLLYTHFRNFFEFKQTYKSHGKDYTKDCTPLDFTDYETKLLTKYKYIPKHTILPQKIELKRLYINSLIENELSKRKQTSKYRLPVRDYTHLYTFNKPIDRICELYNLHDYFDQKKASWNNEYIKQQSTLMNKINPQIRA